MGTHWYSAEINKDTLVASRLDPPEAVRKSIRGETVFLADSDNVHEVLFAIRRQRESGANTAPRLKVIKNTRSGALVRIGRLRSAAFSAA